MLYAVIHDNRLLALRTRRDDAKQSALEAATAGIKYVEHSFLYEPDGKRCEVSYRPARNRRWISTGYFVQAVETVD